MRGLFFACCLAVSALGQTGKLGVFTGSDDVGAPPLKGSAEFDTATRQYKVTGSGADIWGKADQFHYLWREISEFNLAPGLERNHGKPCERPRRIPYT